MPTATGKPGAHPLLVGAYLASSWTWCIGMFLPVLLVRDFGVWGFVTFALPNCLGAAAMGWVLKSPGASAELVNRHAGAMRLFSVVTALFHVFFLAWLASWDKLPFRPELLIGVAAGVSIVVALMHDRLRGWLGVLLWAGVVFVLVRVFLASEPARVSHSLPAPALPSHDVLYLAPVCVFGFLLCPYLDLTFNRARQLVPSRAGGIAAFSVGFLLLFPTMILFTLAYAGDFLGSQTVALALVCSHIAVQAGYTVGVHAHTLLALNDMQSGDHVHALRPPLPRAAQLMTSVLIAWLASVLLHGVFRQFFAAHPPGPAGAAIGLGEIIYRCFMAFYGLVFPAYVWVCMIPTRTAPDATHAGLSGPLGERKFWVLLVAIAAAAPFYYLGFIERQTHWLAVGVGIVLLARLAAKTEQRAK